MQVLNVGRRSISYFELWGQLPNYENGIFDVFFQVLMN